MCWKKSVYEKILLGCVYHNLSEVFVSFYTVTNLPCLLDLIQVVHFQTFYWLNVFSYNFSLFRTMFYYHQNFITGGEGIDGW